MPLDPLSKEARSERMSRIRSGDTKPEIAVRRLAHGMGFRYRLHAKELPGHPDLSFRPKEKVIFVHGCYWHQHGCGKYTMPKSRKDYWLPKLRRNVERNRENIDQLESNGWSVLVIWECELKEWEQLSEKIRKFLS